MAEFTPSIPKVVATCAVGWTYDPLNGNYVSTTNGSGGDTTDIALDAIPNGAEVTDVSFSYTYVKKPTAINTAYIAARFDDYNGQDLSNSRIKAYLNGLNRQYSGQKLRFFFGAGASRTVASSALGNLQVSFYASLTITYIVYVYYGSNGAWVPCEMFYGSEGEWHQVIPYFGENGEWQQA